MIHLNYQIFEQPKVQMAVKYLTLEIRVILQTLLPVVLGSYTMYTRSAGRVPDTRQRTGSNYDEIHASVNFSRVERL